MLFAWAAVAVCVVGVPKTQACGTCGSGTPTLTPVGQGIPVEGRTRLATEIGYRREHDVERGKTVATRGVARWLSSVAYSPTRSLWLSASMPAVLAHARWDDESSAATIGPGDLQLGMRAVLFRDHPLSPTHLVGVQGGMTLPTAISHSRTRRTPQGGTEVVPLPAGAQSGNGSLDLSAGVFHTFLDDPWAVFSEVRLSVPTLDTDALRPGVALAAQSVVQLQLTSNISLRVGVEVSAEGPLVVGSAQRTPEFLALHAAPGILWSPSAPWVLLLGARIPLMRASAAVLRESPTVILSGVLDV